MFSLQKLRFLFMNSELIFFVSLWKWSRGACANPNATYIRISDTHFCISEKKVLLRRTEKVVETV